MGKSSSSSSSDSLAALVQQLQSAKSPSVQTLKTIHDLYVKYLALTDLAQVLAHVRELDGDAFLEDVLWPHAALATAATDATGSNNTSDANRQQRKAYVVSVLVLVNFKFRESAADAWGFLGGADKDAAAQWEAFVATLLSLKHGAGAVEWSVLEKSYLVQFLINCYQSLEMPAIAKTFLKLTSLPMWSALSSTQRQIEFQKYPKLERHWKNVVGSEAADESDASSQEKPAKRQKTTATKKKKSAPPSGASSHEKAFVTELVHEFLELLEEPVKAVKGTEVDQKLLYTALFLAFVADLLSQLPTRRFLQVVLRRVHFLMRVRRSPLVTQCLQWRSQFEITALKKQIALVDAAMRFAIDSHTGKSFSAREQRELASKHIQMLQQCAFQDFHNTPLEELAIVPVSAIADKKSFVSHLKPLVDAERAQVDALAVKLGVISGSEEAATLSNKELIECFVDEYASTASEDVAEWTQTPVFPTELDIWDDLLDSKDKAADSSTVYGADDSTLLPLLPIRKLNLQFLNVADYLQRNYELFRLEAASEIRVNLETAIKQLDAVRSLTSPTAETIFRGHSAMASPLSSPFKIMKISKPSLGKTTPASVVAQFDVELDSRHDFKTFDAFQPKEVVFLVTLRATNDEAAEAMGFAKSEGQDADGLYFPEQYGVVNVRGAEVVEVVDGYGAVLSEENPVGKGRKRTLKVALDGLQYKKDLDDGRLDAYEQVNVLVRRKPRENNFKAVLDTILGAWGDAKREELLPSWLHDLFLGYGDPSAATFASIYKQRQQKEVKIALLDLITDADHVLETCFGENDEKRFVDADEPKTPLAAKDAVGPFTLVEDLQNGGKIAVHAHRKSPKPQSNAAVSPASVRFTKSQVTAVRSGMCEGLTVIVGPPGTGKTDVAVQLVLNLHRTTPPSEKILIVAHSNQALNDFFSKILSRKLINETEIVRLGQGHRLEEGGQNSSFYDDFSRNGRVNLLLQRRLDLLKEVDFLAKWLEQKDPSQYSGLSGSAGYSCENALFFYQFHVRPLLEAARDAAAKSLDDTLLKEYFAARNGAAPDSHEKLLELVTTIDAYFGELHRLQPFELLQTPRQRGDLYLIQHARIVAMTCTHAALNQRKLVDLGLTFGSLIMEEAGQVSEVDTLIPLLLASASSSSAKPEGKSDVSLKRVVLMGDPHQLPPVVKSLALKNYAHLDQSLFTRLLRLDVPRIVLDQQGRSRSALADLYRWKYAAADKNGGGELRDLPRVAEAAEFQAPNAGFAHVAQLIHVPSGHERQVRAFAFENEEEARFVVALVKYMVAIGYSAERISVLATYNAQKELLQRLLRSSSSSSSKALSKCKVSTVDRFQGQQNDFVLLSTVRSGSSVGHLRDVRRACTAFSRARLGLYVFGSETTLRKCKELAPFVSRLLQIAPEQSTQLALIPTERFGGEIARVAPSQQKGKKSSAGGKKSGAEVVQLKKTDGAAQLEKIIADVLKGTKSA